MIRLHTYDFNHRRKQIVKKYLEMLDKVFPFLEEDINKAVGCALTKFCGIDGDSTEFLKIRQAQHNRVKKYNDYMDAYGISSVFSGERTARQKKIEDALLAKKIIKKASDSLYSFLYEDLDLDDPHVKPSQLAELICGHPLQLKEKIGCIDQTDDKENILLDLIFRYGYMIDSNQSQTYEFVKMLGINVCPYCNRNYIFTVQRTENDGFQVRPELDHFLPKSQYPYLAVSFRNLIPACPACNHSKNDFKDIHLYPYEEGMNDRAVFKTRPLNSLNYLVGADEAVDDFELDLVINQDSDHKIQNSISAFGLDRLYKQHKKEVLELFRKKYIFNDDFLYMINQLDENLAVSEQELRSLLGIEQMSSEEWESIPLGKLKTDILREIEELYV